MKKISAWLVILSLVALVTLTGCGAKSPPKATATPKTVSDFFPIKVGDVTVRMQLAIAPMEMEHGLMQRRDLGRDDGMIFVYTKPQKMSFWMHNTPLPLDIGFLDAEGTLREIYSMQPYDETTVSSRSNVLKFCLEMNQGWYRERGVKP